MMENIFYLMHLGFALLYDGYFEPWQCIIMALSVIIIVAFCCGCVCLKSRDGDKQEQILCHCATTEYYKWGYLLHK